MTSDVVTVSGAASALAEVIVQAMEGLTGGHVPIAAELRIAERVDGLVASLRLELARTQFMDRHGRVPEPLPAA